MKKRLPRERISNALSTHVKIDEIIPFGSPPLVHQTTPTATQRDLIQVESVSESDSDTDTCNEYHPVPVTKDPNERKRLFAALEFLSSLKPHRDVQNEKPVKKRVLVNENIEQKASSRILKEVNETVGNTRTIAMDSVKMIGDEDRGVSEQVSLANRRIMYTLKKAKTPFLITSVIPFNPFRDHSTFDRRKCHTFLSDQNLIKIGSHRLELQRPVPAYHVELIENPAFKYSKHRTVISLPGYRGSIIGYVDENTKQIDRDKLFRKHFDFLDKSMTLTRIHKYRRYMVSIVLEIEAEVAIAAIACIIIEKLILRNVLSQPNLPTAVACALVLAAKFIDVDHGILLKLFTKIHRVLNVKKAQILQWEFTIFSELGFDVHYDNFDIYIQVERLLRMMEIPLDEYLSQLSLNEYHQLRYVCTSGEPYFDEFDRVSFDSSSHNV